jgi:predicted ATPase
MNETGNSNRPVLREIAARNLLSFGPEGLSLELKPLNVLIGPNGSGKSNLFEVLALLHAAPTELPGPIRSGGGIRNWLWRRDPANTATLESVVDFPGRQYPLRHKIEFTESNQRFTLLDERIENRVPDPTADEPDFSYRFAKGQAVLSYRECDEGSPPYRWDELATDESILSQRHTVSLAEVPNDLRTVYSSISLYRDWQFGRSNVLRGGQLTDVRQSPLESDLSNLGMFLNRLRQYPATKVDLIEKLSDAYEGLTDFELNFQGGSVEVYFSEGDLAVPASRLSDGSLRYLCLLALLLDPEPPAIVAIEEPEMGLHPDLIPKIADLLVDASSRCQLVVTTHSDVLVDALSERPDSVVVCEKHDGHTTMSRLDGSELAHWLEIYRLGQLWTSGELGGVRW